MINELLNQKWMEFECNPIRNTIIRERRIIDNMIRIKVAHDTTRFIRDIVYHKINNSIQTVVEPASLNLNHDLNSRIVS